MKKSFPSEKQSRRLAWKNLGFPLFNLDFSVFAAAMYVLLSLLVLRAGIASLVSVGLFLGLVVMFTDTSRLAYRLAGGTTHGLLHVGVAVGVTQALSARR